MKKALLILALSISFLGNATETYSTKVDNFKKTDEVLSKVVEKALTVAEKTGEFAIEQAPLLLQEFYAWHIASSCLGVALFVFIISLLFYSLRRLNKWGDKENLDLSDAEYFFPKMLSWTGVLISFVFLCINIYNLAFICFAPKLYLIEYFIK